MKIDAEDILNYHCPRWNELPEIELYIDQVVSILQKNLYILFKEENLPVITASMINNYVKQDVLRPPVKKRYDRSHLAVLFVICIFKRLMSISQIGESIQTMLKVYSIEDAYDMFCEELENALKAVFDSSTEITPNFLKTEVREVAVLQAILSAFANCVFVDRLIYLRKKQEEN